MAEEKNYRTFYIEGEIVDVPSENVDRFIADYPEAKEQKSFIVGEDTVNIPLENVDRFIADYPEAKELYPNVKKKEESEPTSENIGEIYEPSSGPLKDAYKFRSPSLVELETKKSDKFTEPNIPFIENDGWKIPEISKEIRGFDESGNEISINPSEILNEKLKKYQEPLYTRQVGHPAENIYFNDVQLQEMTNEVTSLDEQIAKTAKPGKSGFLISDPELVAQRDVLVKGISALNLGKIDAVKKEIGAKYTINGNPVLFSDLYSKTFDSKFISDVKDGKINVEIIDDNDLSNHFNKQIKNVGAWMDPIEGFVGTSAGLGAAAVNLPDFLWQTVYTIGSGGEIGKVETDNPLRDKLLAVSNEWNQKQFKYKDGILESLKQGNVSDALKQTANASIGSAPYSVMAATTMGLGTVPAAMVMTGISASERSLNNNDITTKDYATELAYDWLYGGMEAGGELVTGKLLFRQVDAFTKTAREMYEQALKTGSKEIADKYIQEIVNTNAKKLITDIAKNTGRSFNEEAISEMATSIGQDLVGNITGAVEHKSVPEIVNNAVEAGIVGGVSGAGMAQIGNVGLAAASLQNKKDREKLSQLNADIKLLGNKIYSQDIDNVAKVKLLKMAEGKRAEQFDILRQKREQAEQLDKEEIEKLTQNALEQKSIVEMLATADEQFTQLLNDRLSEIEKENAEIVANAEITPQAEIGYRGIEEEVDVDADGRDINIGKVFEKQPQEVTDALDLFGKSAQEIATIQDMYSRNYDLTLGGIKNYYSDKRENKLKPVTRPLVPKKNIIVPKKEETKVEPITNKIKPTVTEIANKESDEAKTEVEAKTETTEIQESESKKEPDILTEKPQEDAIQEQKPDESVLLQEKQELGLQEVEQGDVKQEITPQQGEATQEKVETTPVSNIASRIAMFTPKADTESKTESKVESTTESKVESTTESKAESTTESKAKQPITVAERIASMTGAIQQQEDVTQKPLEKLDILKDRIKQAKEKRREIKDKKGKLGIASDPFKETEAEAEADRELINAYIDLARYYISKGVDNLKQFIAKLRDDNDDIDEDIAKKAWNEANLTTGEHRRSSLKQRIKDNLDNIKGSPLLKEKIEKEGVEYEVEDQDMAWKYAEYVINEVGIDGAIDMVNSNDIKGATSSFIYGQAIDMYSEQIKKSKTQSEKAIYEFRRNELIDQLALKNRRDGRSSSAMYYWYLKSPSGLAAVIIRDIESVNESKLKDTSDPKTSKRGKIKEVKKELDTNRKKASETAAENVVYGSDNKGKDKPKSKKELSPEKKARRDELRKKYSGIFNDITNLVRLLGDKEFIEYGSLLIEEGYITFEEFSKEAIKQLGKKVKPILGSWYKNSGGKDDLSLYEAEQKRKKLEQKSDETSAEKLAKRIIERIKEPVKNKFDAEKEMLQVLMGKVEEKLEKTEPGQKRTAIDKIKEAILNFDEYKDVWDSSKQAVFALIEIQNISEEQKQEYRDILTDYINEKIGVPFGKKEAVGAMREVIGSGLTKMVKQYLNVGVDLDVAIEEIVEKIAYEAGIESEEQIEAIRRNVVERFGEINANIKDAKAKAEAKKAEIAKERERVKEENRKEKERTGGVNKPLWPSRKQGIANAVISKLESGIIGTDKKSKTAVEEFANRLKQRMLSQLPSKAQENNKKNYIEIIKEAILNFDEYKEAISQAREDIIKKHGDNPAQLMLLDDALFGLTEKPFSNNVINKALRESMMEQMGVDNTPHLKEHIVEILSSSTNNKNATKQELIDRAVSDLIEGTGITTQQAQMLAEQFAFEYENIMSKEAKSLLKRALPDTILDTVRNKAKKSKKTEIENLVDQIMWGALNDSEFEKKFYAKYGLVNLTSEQKNAILQMAEDAMNEPEGSDARINKLIDLDLYRKHIVKEGIGFLDIFIEQNYNNILMAMDTFVGALLYNMQQTFGIDVALAVLRNPKNASLVFDAAYKNRRDGKITLNKSAIEGINALNGKITGRQIREKTYHTTSVGRVLEKYGKNKVTRTFGKYLQISSKVLSGIDASTSARSADMRLIEMIADHIRKENKKQPKSNQLTEKEVKEFTRFILGYENASVTHAREKTENEFKKRYNVNDIDDLSKEQLQEFKSQVLHYLEQATEERAVSAAIVSPIFKSLIVDNQLEYYIQQSQKYGNQAALMGKPPGTLGVLAAALQNSIGTIPLAKLSMTPFINASLNMLNYMVMGNPVVASVRMGQAIYGKRIISKFVDKESVLHQVSKLDLELSDHDRRDIITKSVVFMILSHAMAVMVGASDDDDYETGVSGGKWKRKTWFITGGMHGGKYGFVKNEEERKKEGLEPYTLYYKGSPMMNYITSPLISVLGFAGAINDYKYFSDKDKNAEKTLYGKYIGVNMVQISMFKDISMMSSLSDMIDAIFGQNRYSESKFTERAILSAEKQLGTRLRSFVFPREFLTLNRDVKAVLNMDNKKADELFEFFAQDVPFLEDMILDESGYDKYGRPIKEQFKRKGIPMRVFDGDIVWNGQQVIASDKYANLDRQKKFNRDRFTHREVYSYEDIPRLANNVFYKDKYVTGYEIPEELAREIDQNINDAIRKYMDDNYSELTELSNSEYATRMREAIGNIESGIKRDVYDKYFGDIDITFTDKPDDVNPSIYKGE